MSDIQIYGLDAANNKVATLSYEQTVALIQEMAANNWQVPDGYIPTTAVNGIVEQSTGNFVKLFINTQAVWDAWQGDKKDMLFFPTDDTSVEGINEQINNLKADMEENYLKKDNHLKGFLVYGWGLARAKESSSNSSNESGYASFRFIWYTTSDIASETIQNILDDMTAKGAFYGSDEMGSYYRGYPCTGEVLGSAGTFITGMYRIDENTIGLCTPLFTNVNVTKWSLSTINENVLSPTVRIGVKRIL